MKIKEASISILVSEDVTRIELFDKKSRTIFCDIKLTPQQLSQALSRLSNVSCEIEVRGLEKLNKEHQNTSFVFEIPSSDFRYNKLDELKDLAIKMCPEGWEPDLTFNSQNSFFSEDNKQYARTIIRRWV